MHPPVPPRAVAGEARAEGNKKPTKADGPFVLAASAGSSGAASRGHTPAMEEATQLAALRLRMSVFPSRGPRAECPLSCLPRTHRFSRTVLQISVAKFYLALEQAAAASAGKSHAVDA